MTSTLREPLERERERLVGVAPLAVVVVVVVVVLLLLLLLLLIIITRSGQHPGMILLMIRHAKRVTQGVLRCKIAGHAACGAHMTLSGFSISEGALIEGACQPYSHTSHATRHVPYH